MKRLSFAATVGAVLALVAGPASAQNTYTWNTTPSGAWLSTASWYSTAGTAYPGTSSAAGGGAATDIARFALQNGTATGTVGIDGTAAGTLRLGAIDFANSSSLTIQSSTGAGTMRLDGATVNAVANTLVAVRSTANNQTIANTNGLGVQLGITNGVFNVFGDANPITITQPFFGGRTLTISAAISEAAAGSGFTLQGGGTLVLSGTNTFTGDVTITSGRIQMSNASALGTTAGKTVVANGGTLQITSAMTLNENIDLAGNGFTEHATLFGALRIDNVATTLGGNLTLTGNSRIWVGGNTTTANGTITETGGARGLDFAGAGTFALTNAGSYTGVTTVSQGILDLSGANGALSGTTGVTVTQGGTFRLTNSAAAFNGTRVNDAAGITLNGGTFNYAHTAGAQTYTESVGALTIQNYNNTVTTSQAVAGQSSTLNFSSLTVRASGGGGVNFTGTGLGTNNQNRVFFTAAPTQVNGILGGWATFGLTATDGNFAAYGGVGVGVLAATTTTTTDGTGWGAATNLRMVGAGPTLTAGISGGNPVVNSLAFIHGGGGSVFDLNNNNLRLNSGGVIVAGNPGGQAIISNGGGGASSLTAGNGANTAGELIFNISAGTELRMLSPLTNNGTGVVSLTKLGGGNLLLDGVNSFTGAVVIAGSSDNSGITLGNKDGFGSTTFPTAITIRAATGNTGNRLQINPLLVDNAAVLRPLTSPLNMEGFVTGGVSNNFGNLAAGINQRSSFVTGNSNTVAGLVTLTGNHVAQFSQTGAGNTLLVTGNVVAGAGGFTGQLAVNGAGTVQFNGTINLPSGTLATFGNDNTRFQLPNAATTVLGLNPQQGIIRLGGSSQLPAAVTVTLGSTNGTTAGQFWLNGFNQTVAGLRVAPGSTTNQIVQNGSATTNSTLTFAGGATNASVFGGVIQNGAANTLALAVTSGTLYLNGTNTYTGGTTVSGTGTLGGTGSVTGSVVVNSGGNLAPGNSIGTFNVTGGASVMTLATGSKYTVEYDHNGGAFTPGTNIDRILSAGTLTATGNVTIDLKYLGLPAVNSTGTQQVVIGSFSAAPNIAGATFNITGDFFAGTTPTVGVQGNNLVLNFTPVPEPATMGLVSAGLLGGLAALRRRRKAA